ncbi:MAG TPA: hypothetical protein VGF79_08880 [Bacteroidia bacterium]
MEESASKKKSIDLKLILSVIGILTPIIGFILLTKDFKEKIIEQPKKLSGIWTIKFTVKTAKYRPYIGETYEYEVYVTQDEFNIKGNGEQTLYNGEAATSHFQFEIPDVSTRKELKIPYVLKAHRTTQGIMTLQIDKKNSTHLTGQFNSAIADMSGDVEIQIK